MNNKFKVTIFGILLIMLMSVAVAAEVSDDTTTVDTIAEEVEPVATEVTSPQTDNILEENDIETDMVYSGENPQTISTLENKTNTKTINKKNLISKKTDEQSPSIITLTTENFSTYVTDGRFNEKVNEGDVIDFNGLFDGTKYSLTIDKPLNLTSLNNNAYLIFHSNANGGGNGFNIIKGGSGSNVTNIIFHNTHVRTEEAANITFNNISLTCDTGIGYGVGAISIRSSDNVNITNSYFKSKINGGHSTVVYSTSNNCLFENNTILGEGNVGNLFYITTYGGSGFSYNITIRNNYIDNTKAYNQSICQAMVISGAGHLIENNTIVANEWALGIQYYDPDFGEEGNPGEGTSIVKDNLILQGMMSKNENITYINNTVVDQKPTILINDDNWDEYVESYKISSRKMVWIFSENLPDYCDVYFNLTQNYLYDKFVGFTLDDYVADRDFIKKKYGEYGVQIKEINSTYDLPLQILGERTSILNLWAPTTTINIRKDVAAGVIINSTYSQIVDRFGDGGDTYFENTYRFDLANNKCSNPNTGEEFNILTNENYNTFFDETTHILKEGENYNFAIIEDIVNPIIINKAVNIIGFNSYGKGSVNNLSLVAGSENSNISCLKINNLTIQDTSNINIENNTIDGLLILNNSQFCKIISNDMDVVGRRITHPDSNIILYGSLNNIIKDKIHNITITCFFFSEIKVATNSLIKALIQK